MRPGGFAGARESDVTGLRAFVIGVALVAPVAGFGEEMGTISGELGGEARSWHTISMEQGGELHSSAELARQNMFTMLHLQAHPEARFTTKDVLNIDLMWMGDPKPGAAPASVDVMHMPTGMQGPYWTSQDAPEAAQADFTIERDGDRGRVSGTFRATLCRQDSPGAAPDTGDCKAISGTVESGLLVRGE